MLGKFIKPVEDSLTASVFSHLWHLPAELFWQILMNACYSDRLPHHPGEPLEIKYWPQWDATGTQNKRRVIPDVFIRFARLDLIVESKRGDDGGQIREQWENQVKAYRNEHGADDKEVTIRFIALGGIGGTADTEIHLPASSDGKLPEIRCPVHMCRWSRLLAECKRMEKALSGLQYRSAEMRAHLRILLDLMHLFARHGYQTGIWFEAVQPLLPTLGATATSGDLFREISQELCNP